MRFCGIKFSGRELGLGRFAVRMLLPEFPMSVAPAPVSADELPEYGVGRAVYYVSIATRIPFQKLGYGSTVQQVIIGSPVQLVVACAP